MLTVWQSMGVVAVGGVVGGAINALLSDNGFAMPRSEVGNGVTIVRPGCVGNMLTGAVAAVVSWGLYGPFANASLFGANAAPAASGSVPQPTPSMLVGAILIGVGGAKWLTDQVDKKLLRATAATAAAAGPDAGAASRLSQSTPFDAFQLSKKMTGH